MIQRSYLFLDDLVTIKWASVDLSSVDLVLISLVSVNLVSFIYHAKVVCLLSHFKIDLLSLGP